MRRTRPPCSSVNPTCGLVSDAAGTADMLRAMRDGLPPSVQMGGHDCPDTAYLMSAYYRTDHHWRTDEAYLSYAEALSAMMPGATTAEVTDEREFASGFLGSTVRLGLMLPNVADSIVDCRIDMSSLQVFVNGAEVAADRLDSWERYENMAFKRWSFTANYANYFHSDYGFLEISNPAAQSQDSLLIVGSSYTNCMERFFAANYAHVYKIDGRYTDLLADDFLADHPEIRQVLIVGQAPPILVGALASNA
ncbi:MAG: DHHW family protein [Coriobacteriales bacterium]|nr:DHHW family protein [Coriobacteriales bacterium]